MEGEALDILPCDCGTTIICCHTSSQ